MLNMVAHAYDPKSRRLRQEEIESEACLGYIAISRPAGHHSKTLSYMNKNHTSKNPQAGNKLASYALSS